MRVLGIDCGTEYTGYGVVDLISDSRNRDQLVCIICGAIKVSPREPMPTRLSRISTGLQELIVHHRPDRVAIEDVFYATNVKSALKLGQVRGVAMLAAASAGLEVAEYSPLSIKSAVVGYGRAEKHQVQQMVARLLNLDEIPQPADAADALAIAICHLHTAATHDRQGRDGQGNDRQGNDRQQSERSGFLPDISVVATCRLSRATSTVAPDKLRGRRTPDS